MGRNHYQNSCEGKHRHPSEGKALAHASSVYNITGEKLKPYYCLHCKSYHIGHVPKGEARKEWERVFNG